MKSINLTVTLLPINWPCMSVYHMQTLQLQQNPRWILLRGST